VENMLSFREAEENKEGNLYEEVKNLSVLSKTRR
jgi:hypothetical protein